jgi:hypothetical protein
MLPIASGNSCNVAGDHHLAAASPELLAETLGDVAQS